MITARARQTSSTLDRRVRVLVVDDDTAAQRTLCKALESQGYKTTAVGAGDGVRTSLSEQDFAVVLIELNLNQENGLDLVREFSTNYDIPFIIVSGRSDPMDRVVGLELGADDYISKPYHVRELIARVGTVVRRYQRAIRRAAANDQDQERYHIDGFLLDTARRQLTDTNGQKIELTTAEYNLLHLFVAKPNRVLTRSEIMDQLKGHDWSPTDRSIDVLVAKLRKKFSSDSESEQFIRTIRGAGYMMVNMVKRLKD